MSEQTTRERILARLHNSGTEQTEVPATPPLPALSLDLDRDQKIERLTELMSAVRTEVHIVESGAWQERLKTLAREKGWRRILYGPKGPLGTEIEALWDPRRADRPELVAYTQPVEAFKEELFESIDVGLTSTVGAVADTGAVALWPTADEPRLLSLVPPVHVAVLDADNIFNSLGDMVAAQNWSAGMPSNLLLVSGPSKTADIEFTLVFGVHGPKELVLLIRT